MQVSLLFRFETAIKRLAPNQQEIIRKTMFKTHLTIFNHFLNTSPLLFISIKPLFILVDLVSVIRIFKNRIMEDFRIWKPIDAQANFIGMQIT